MENYDKILYEMSFKEPPNLKSEEVYFNKTTSLELVLTNLVSDLRALYNDFFKVDYSMIKSNNTKYAAIIEGAIKKYERQFANAVNAEKVVIGLTTETNASAFPMVWDDRLISENIEKIGSERITFDKKFAASLEDVMATDDGFKFRDKKGKIIIILLGLGLFNLDITDEEYVGLIIHEWGHCIEQILLNVNATIYCDYKRQMITDLVEIFDFIGLKYLHVDPGRVFTGFVTALPKLFIHFFDHKKGLKKIEKESKGDQQLAGELLAKKVMAEFDRKEIVEDALYTRAYTINKILKSKPKDIKKSFFKIIFAPVVYLFKSIGALGWLFFLPFRAILDPRNKIVNFNKRFLKKELRYEQFADYVATAYGYGQYQSAVLRKSATKGKQDGKELYLLNFLHYVPLVNLLIAYANNCDTKANSLLNGYPSSIERMEAMYKSLEYELQTNKDLSETVKNAIRKDMEAIKEEHEAYKRKKGARFFVSRIFYKITRRSIEKVKDTSNIKENVLDYMGNIVIENNKELGLTEKDLKEVENELIAKDSVNEINSQETLDFFKTLNFVKYK